MTFAQAGFDAVATRSIDVTVRCRFQRFLGRADAKLQSHGQSDCNADKPRPRGADESFDFVYETCLCYLPEDSIDDAIRELFRICRVGVVCGSIATDMTSEIIESEDLFYGIETFASMPEWGECYTRNGFQLAIQDPAVLRRVWKIEQKSNEGSLPWYPDAETMRYCFYSKPNGRGR